MANEEARVRSTSTGAVAETSDAFAALLKKEFKPRSDRAREDVNRSLFADPVFDRRRSRPERSPAGARARRPHQESITWQPERPAGRARILSEPEPARSHR